MSTLPTANMNLPVPVVGSESGPQYATDVNNCFTLVDQHNHSPGYGVQITPDGLNINSALTLNDNFLTAVAGLTLQVQAGLPALNTVYESGVDLYFVDGLGNNIQITSNGGVAGSPGSISNLTSPASASYVAANKTFVWQSDVSIAANLDAASIILRNITPNSTFGLTLNPPAGLGSNYSITLPTLPAATNFLQMDSSGNITASTAVTALPSASSQAQVDAGSNNTTFVTPATLAGKTRMAIFTTAGSHTWTAPTGVTEVIVYAKGGGGGGGGGGYGQNPTLKGGGGGGGGGTTSIPMHFAVTPGTQYTIVVGDGGAGGAGAVSQGTGGTNGSSGGASSFNSVTFRNIGAGGSGGGGNSQTGGVGGNASAFSWAGTGGTGGAGGIAGSAGDNSINKSGGAAGTGDTFTGGGGGGGAGDANGGAGGNASAGAAAVGSNGSGGGGGHGGNPGTGATPGAGAKGGAGSVAIVYIDNSTTNSNT